MKNLYLAILIALFTTGCASLVEGYTPKANLNNDTVWDKKERKDITFSISYYEEAKNDISEKFVRDTIKEKFIESNLFKRVHYVPFKQKGRNHYHFDIKITGTSREEFALMGMFSAFTYFLLPVEGDSYVDTTMFVLKNGKEVYSIMAPELIRDVHWLPYVAIFPFYTYDSVRKELINNSIEYFLNNIIENNLY